MSDNGTPYDVAIIGGGPAGTTAATILKKYAPEKRVVILERSKFPREHVGESQLPLVSLILDEMGCWDKVEAANFPIKLGASFTWGRDPEPWDFNFYPPEKFVNEPRPAKFEGQRRYTAFQVDRAIYDEILLRHAEEMGVEVRQDTNVKAIARTGDRIDGFELDDGEVVTARHYIDASGAVGFLRRAMDIEIEAPEKLRNIAIWDYWENAEWAEEIGVGGTRVQVRSIPYGWIWFIPIGETRTSIGFICHSDYYKDCGKSPKELYLQALGDESFISSLLKNATTRDQVETTRDWSFAADRLYGENWFLVGEAAGFADPILAAGLTLHQSAARDAAYTINELDLGEYDRDWLLQRFNEKNLETVAHHIRFAMYWYSANGLQTDLQEYCREIAASVGLRLNAKDAFKWISQGAFATEILGAPSIGLFDLTSMHELTSRFGEGKTRWLIDGHSIFKLNLHNAEQGFVGDLRDGRIHQVPCYLKDGKRLPLCEFYGLAVELLGQTDEAHRFMELADSSLAMLFPEEHRWFARSRVFEALESMALDGWVICKRDRNKPPLQMADEVETIRSH